MTTPVFTLGQRVCVQHLPGVPRPRCDETRVTRIEYRGLLKKPEWYYRLSNGLWYAESELHGVPGDEDWYGPKSALLEAADACVAFAKKVSDR